MPSPNRFSSAWIFLRLFSAAVFSAGLTLVRSGAGAATRFELDPVFAPSQLQGPVTGALNTLPLADGGALVWGAFEWVNSIPVRPLVRLNASGWLVNSPARFASALFADAVFQAPQPLAQLADGAVLFSQTSVGANGSEAVASRRARLKKVRLTGEVDSAYSVVVEPGPYERAEVRGGWTLADGRVLIAGSFANVGGHATRDVAVIFGDGTVDTRFVSTTDFNGAAAVGADGRFVGVAPNAREGWVYIGFAPNKLVLLGPTGGETDSWALSGGGVLVPPNVALAVDDSGRILASISQSELFTISVGEGQPIAPPIGYRYGSTTVFRFERGQPEGRVFYSEPSSWVSELHPLDDGSVLLVGPVAQLTEHQPRGVLKVNANGTADPGFSADIADDVRINHLARTATGWLATTHVETPGAIARPSLAKLDHALGVVRSYGPDFRAFANVEAAHALPDGGVLLQGVFTPFGGVDAQRFVKLRGDGAFDFTHVPRPADPSAVNVIHVGTDGWIYVVSAGGTVIERYAPDGARDEVFGQRQLADDAVTTITAVHVDTAGRILVGGHEPAPYALLVIAPASSARGVVQRLLPSGERDAGFVFQNTAPGLGYINAIAELPGKGYAIAGSGKLVSLAENGAPLGSAAGQAHGYEAAVARLVRSGGYTYALGDFTALLGVRSSGIARLRADGFPDPVFSVEFDARGVVAVQTLNDGRLLITRDVYSSDPIGPPARHVILTADGLVDPNEILPVPAVPPGISDPAEISRMARTTLTLARDGLLHEFFPDGRGRRFRPVARTALIPLGAGIVSVGAGERLRLEVRLPSGVGASGTLRWYRNGQLIAGEVGAGNGAGTVFEKTNAGPNDTGVYTVRYDEAGSAPVFATFRVRVSPAGARISSATARSFVGEGASGQVVGFVVEGYSGEPTLLRTIQSDLSAFGVSAPAKKTTMSLYVNGGLVTRPNPPFVWERPVWALDTLVLRAGAFRVSDLQANPHTLLNPHPGSGYTLHFSATSGDAGVALNEVYLPTPLVGGLYEPTPQRFVGFSCRGEAGDGERVLVAGFAIEGNRQIPVLIQGLGPKLRAIGFAEATADPVLELYRGQQLILSNDDWDKQPNPSAITQAAARFGSWALEAGSADAALLTLLDPGVYTVRLRTKDGGGGVGMIEIYDVQK